MKRITDFWVAALVIAAVVGFIALAVFYRNSGSDDSHNRHPITVIERKVDRIKAKQSAQIAADRRTLHQLSEVVRLFGEGGP